MQIDSLLQPQHYQPPQQQRQQGSFDPDDMEIDIDLSLASLPASSFPQFVPYANQGAFANTSPFTPSLSQPPDPSECPLPASAFSATNVPPSQASASTVPTLLYSPSSITPANTSSSSYVTSSSGTSTRGQSQASCRVQTIQEELHDVECDAERRQLPFACSISDCQR